MLLWELNHDCLWLATKQMNFHCWIFISLFSQMVLHMMVEDRAEDVHVPYSFLSFHNVSFHYLWNFISEVSLFLYCWLQACTLCAEIVLCHLFPMTLRNKDLVISFIIASNEIQPIPSGSKISDAPKILQTKPGNYFVSKVESFKTNIIWVLFVGIVPRLVLWF